MFVRFAPALMHKNVGQQCCSVCASLHVGKMHKNVGQHFGYLIRDEIISNAFEDIGPLAQNEILVQT